MTEDSQPTLESPVDGAPIWLRAVQAAGVGLAAGLVLHLLLSLVVVQGRELRARPNAPAECKKSSPARESGAPSHRPAPSASEAPAATMGRG